MIVGSVITPHLRLYDAADGTLLLDRNIGQPGTLSGIGSGAAVLDGTLVVGTGIGARSSGGSSPGDFAANTPSAVVALCVPGAPGCPAPPPVIVPGGVTVTEGTGGLTTARVPLRLSSASSEPVTVEWETLDLPGHAGHTDVVAASGTVTFAPRQTEASVEVEVRGDRLDELDEYAVVRFHDPVGGTLGGFYGLGLVHIIDDDPPPTATALLGLAREGDAPGRGLRVPIVLSAPSGRTVTITWHTEDGTARAPSDYAATHGTVVLAAWSDPWRAGDPPRGRRAPRAPRVAARATGFGLRRQPQRSLRSGSSSTTTDPERTQLSQDVGLHASTPMSWRRCRSRGVPRTAIRRTGPPCEGAGNTSIRWCCARRSWLGSTRIRRSSVRTTATCW